MIYWQSQTDHGTDLLSHVLIKAASQLCHLELPRNILKTESPDSVMVPTSRSQRFTYKDRMSTWLSRLV